MSKEMNNLKAKVTKYDMTSGLFMSLIIGIIFSLKPAIVYLLGVTMAMINFQVSIYGTENWIFKKNKKGLILIVTICRILLVSALIIPFRNNVELLIAYLLGIITHYPVLIYCTLKKKGSA
ncbi:hypothetical protein ACQPU1_05025 [Clostridium paraputrificum]|uniref:hypothetical protein n=1 Tax=Clostridium paraputrificum TaxID=29363 RepID=UPI003D342541